MLHVTLDQDDYFMIGDDIRVQYKKNEGNGRFIVTLTAPPDMRVSHDRRTAIPTKGKYPQRSAATPAGVY